MNRDFFGGKKVLVMGLGRFGGGLDAAIFARDAGAKVTVTDSAGPEKLAEAVNQLKQYPEIELHLGGHCAVDFAACDVLVVNPAVRPQNPFIESARKGGAVVTSQIEIFFQLCPACIIGITGSNGKSTTTALTAHLLNAGLTSRGGEPESRIENRESKIENAPEELNDAHPEIQNGTHPEEQDRLQTQDARPKTSDLRHKTENKNQKSTYDMRHTTYEKIWLGGNIGNMPLLTRLSQIKPNDLVVLELSSFQLEQLAQSELAPDVALVTNLAPNHIDRHGTFKNYCKAKENIFTLQRPTSARRHQNHPGETRPTVSIFNADDPIAMKWYEKYKNQTGRVCLTFSHKQVSQSLRASFKLPGRANLENLAAAVTIAQYFGIEDERLVEAAGTFRSLPHRLELVAEINGTRWYNDSVSTTPESSIVALNAFSEPKIIIAGGYDKGVGFEALGREIAGKAKAVVLIGKTSEKIEKEIKKYLTADCADYADLKNKVVIKKAGPSTELRTGKIIIKKAGSLSEAVGLSAELAGPGEVVLLSPACASYDMFDDFRHRGEVFKECVKKISG